MLDDVAKPNLLVANESWQAHPVRRLFALVRESLLSLPWP